MKIGNRNTKLQKIAEHLGGTIKRIGQTRYRGGRLVALEGPNGKKAIANYKTVFSRGKPVGSNLAGWVAL